jgi:hypothetical protein
MHSRPVTDQSQLDAVNYARETISKCNKKHKKFKMLDKGHYLLGQDAVKSGRYLPIFLPNLQPPSSW